MYVLRDRFRDTSINKNHAHAPRNLLMMSMDVGGGALINYWRNIVQYKDTNRTPR